MFDPLSICHCRGLLLCSSPKLVARVLEHNHDSCSVVGVVAALLYVAPGLVTHQKYVDLGWWQPEPLRWRHCQVAAAVLCAALIQHLFRELRVVFQFLLFLLHRDARSGQKCFQAHELNGDNFWCTQCTLVLMRH